MLVKKIYIIGTVGTGKTTLAKSIANSLKKKFIKINLIVLIISFICSKLKVKKEIEQIQSEFRDEIKVVKIDAENNLIAIKGAIPGPKGGIVVIANAKKA